MRNLVKNYHSTRAVDGVSFSARSGEITAVLGPNGAGKTTTIECCEGLRSPDEGSISILGHDPHRAPPAIRERVGVMLQDGGLPMAVPAGVALRHIARLFDGDAPRRVQKLVDELGLEKRLRTPIRRLSGGERQRLAMACALVGRPDVLFLDEPTAGMDPHARLGVHSLINKAREDGTAIIMTTHLLDEAEKLADRIILMAHGQVVADGSPREVTEATDQSVHLHLSRPVRRLELLPGLATGLSLGPIIDGETSPDQSHTVWRVEPTPSPVDLAQLTAHLALLDIGLHEMRQSNDLTSVFLKIAENQAGEDS